MNQKVFEQFPVLTTERLTLREITVGDVDSIYGIYSDPKVAEYDDFNPIESKEVAMKVIHKFQLEFEEHEQIRWGIARKSDNTLIGTCGPGNFESSAQRCEIGYDLLQSEWNKGYMTEALKAMVAFLFEEMGFNRVEAFVTPGNEGSIRVLQKVNFVEEGLLRERDFFKGCFQDGIIFAILKRDYELLKAQGK